MENTRFLICSLFLFTGIYCSHDGWRIPDFWFALYSYSQELLLFLGWVENTRFLICSLFLLTGTFIVPRIGGEYPILDLLSILAHRNFYCSQDGWRIPDFLICSLFLLTGTFVVPIMGGRIPNFGFVLYSCSQGLLLFLGWVEDTRFFDLLSILTHRNFYCP